MNIYQVVPQKNFIYNVPSSTTIHFNNLYIEIPLSLASHLKSFYLINFEVEINLMDLVNGEKWTIAGNPYKEKDLIMFHKKSV